jgi:hypothetical protein
MKNKRLRTSKAFLAMVHCRSMVILDKIVTMAKSAVAFHTPQAKQQRKQWLRKDMPGLIKSKVRVTRTKKIWSWPSPRKWALL